MGCPGLVQEEGQDPTPALHCQCGDQRKLRRDRRPRAHPLRMPIHRNDVMRVPGATLTPTRSIACASRGRCGQGRGPNPPGL